jgi:crotonobetainyl-CoA:carnitine CoA-transferase CaiB-like acyl-CoA transferase
MSAAARQDETARPLTGITVVEFGTGVASAYCTKLFADMGANVWRLAADSGTSERDLGANAPLDPDAPETAGLYAAYLNAGKRCASPDQQLHDVDLVVIGEDCAAPTCPVRARVATLSLTWFGTDGPLCRWHGSELAVQALAGLIHPVGPVEGPPMYPGPHHATTLAGTSAYVAGMAALLGDAGHPLALEVSVLEAVMALSEYQICLSESLPERIPRLGVNRFKPTCPLSIHACKDGWIGITPITPTQWGALCEMLDLPALAADPKLQLARDRVAHVEHIEAAFGARFATRTAPAWARLGRAHKVPMVVVPDAQAILDHPIFNARDAFAWFERDGQRYRVPKTPFALTRSPARAELDRPQKPGQRPASTAPKPVDSPLAGVRIVDFSMGWAGPLASRILSDYGAEVVKIEAGRYPDWWRGVDWSPAAIDARQYETSRHFAALNRGKKSVSLDLTSARGLALARQLVSKADAVVENQAAGVLRRLGLGYDTLASEHPQLVMLSMCAFGSDNAWSETRAYGSVLEQGSGLPHFAGLPDSPPMMAHLAYGDPVGGLYGAAALVTAIYQQRAEGAGQWINAAQIEAMLPFTTPALLLRQASGREPQRRGNRHPHYVPHGCFACHHSDTWLALAVDDQSWPALCAVLGREDWRSDTSLCTASGRRLHECAIEEALSQWAHSTNAADAAALLQAAGVSAAAVASMQEVTGNAQLEARKFFHEVHREHVALQLQAGLPVRLPLAQRYPLRLAAPLLGQHSREILLAHTDVDEAEFEALVTAAVVSMTPTQLRR